MNVSHNLVIRPNEKTVRNEQLCWRGFFRGRIVAFTKMCYIFLCLTFCEKYGSYHIVSICCVVTKALKVMQRVSFCSRKTRDQGKSYYAVNYLESSARMIKYIITLS